MNQAAYGFEMIDLSLPCGSEQQVFLCWASVVGVPEIPGHRLVAVFDNPDLARRTFRKLETVHVILSENAFTSAQLELVERNTNKLMQFRDDRDFAKLIPAEGDRVYKYDPATRTAELDLPNGQVFKCKLELDRVDANEYYLSCQDIEPVGLDDELRRAATSAITDNDLFTLEKWQAVFGPSTSIKQMLRR